MREDSTWRVAELPHRIQARKLDCGDVSPADLDHLMRALNSGASGIQVCSRGIPHSAGKPQ